MLVRYMGFDPYTPKEKMVFEVSDPTFPGKRAVFAIPLKELTPHRMGKEIDLAGIKLGMGASATEETG